MYSTATRTHILHSFPLSPTQSGCNQKGQGFSQFPKPTNCRHPADEVVSRVSGLKTPPLDDMGTTYQAPNLTPYESHQAPLSNYHTTMTQIDRSRSSMRDVPGQDSYSRYQPFPHLQQQSQSQQPQARHAIYSAPFAAVVSAQSSSRQSTRSSTPNSAHGNHIGSGGSAASRLSSRDSQSMVLHSLQIPACISLKGGNLADFSAQLTCLFWFESPKTLDAADNIRNLGNNSPAPRLIDNAIPSMAFKKWVQTVLSTTQVTQNVILLALMFIHRLKMTNPAVRGRPGSEYRLLTVALMLGNKFLDDNTYTNKTWAEVSGISVKEIHVMEVEFLSNMRYALLASKDQWEEWLVKLAKYFEYCDRAMRPISPLIIPSPTTRSFNSPLPSPTSTSTLQNNFVQSTSPRSMNGTSSMYSPTNSAAFAGNTPSISAWPTTYQTTSALSPLANRPDLGNIRKRSMVEDNAAEPASKRVNRLQQSAHTAFPDPIRLPVPNLTLNTAHTVPATQSQYTPTTYATQQPPSLPPLTSGMRAMATVYPSTVTSWAPQPSVLATSGPTMPSSSMAPATTQAVSTAHYPPPSGYGTPTKRLSPINTLTPSAAAYGTSPPLTDHFPSHGHGIHTPISHSPSVYLQQRPSPYKPIRHVNTLLYPPPSASLHEYHLSGQAVPPTQMHYQPLGRRNEYRTGIVPEFQTTYGQGQMRQQYPSASSQQRMPPDGHYQN